MIFFGLKSWFFLAQKLLLLKIFLPNFFFTFFYEIFCLFFFLLFLAYFCLNFDFWPFCPNFGLIIKIFSTSPWEFNFLLAQKLNFLPTFLPVEPKFCLLCFLGIEPFLSQKVHFLFRFFCFCLFHSILCPNFGLKIKYFSSKTLSLKIIFFFTFAKLKLQLQLKLSWKLK